MWCASTSLKMPCSAWICQTSRSPILNMMLSKRSLSMKKMRLVDDLLQECEKHQGIDLNKCRPNVEILVETQNHFYTLITGNEAGEVTITGGKYFPKPTQAIVNGSTWGGSCLKMKWLGPDMCMEVWCNK